MSLGQDCDVASTNRIRGEDLAREGRSALPGLSERGFNRQVVANFSPLK